MLDHQHRDAEFGADVADPERHVVGLFDVQAGRRLVEQHQLRLRTQRPRKLDHLADAVRQAGDQLVAIGLEVEQFDHLLDLVAMVEFGAPHGGQIQQLLHEVRRRMAVPADQKVAQHGRVVEQLDVLEGARDPHLGDVMRRRRGELLAVEHQPARGRVIEPRDQVEDRGLAGAVRADDREDLPLLDGEVDLIDRLQAAELQREVFRNSGSSSVALRLHVGLLPLERRRLVHREGLEIEL